jgi:hypothetical protein
MSDKHIDPVINENDSSVNRKIYYAWLVNDFSTTKDIQNRANLAMKSERKCIGLNE